MHVTQSAVRHQIRQLEEWFGFALFNRQGRQTVATPKGGELARAMAKAFDIMSAACKRIVQSDTGPALTIASLPSIATIWLIPKLSAFFREHPEISVKIVYAFHGQGIDFEDFDIAILWGKGDWEDARVTRFLDGATVAVCNTALLEKEGPFASPQSLLGKSLLHDTDRTGWQSWMRAAGLKHAGPSPGPIFEDFNLLRWPARALRCVLPRSSSMTLHLAVWSSSSTSRSITIWPITSSNPRTPNTAMLRRLQLSRIGSSSRQPPEVWVIRTRMQNFVPHPEVWRPAITNISGRQQRLEGFRA